jgi:hypothetical protein
MGPLFPLLGCSARIYFMKWKHFETEIILLNVRWYLQYRFSYRDLIEVMSEPAELPYDGHYTSKPNDSIELLEIAPFFTVYTLITLGYVQDTHNEEKSMLASNPAIQILYDRFLVSIGELCTFKVTADYCPSLGFKGLSHIYSLIRRISTPCIIAVLQKVSLLDTVVPFLDMREQKKRVEHFSKCYSSARILHFLLGVHHPMAQRVYALTFLPQYDEIY